MNFSQVLPMALSPTGGGYVASSGFGDTSTDLSLPIFNIERVQLQFNLTADFIAAQVANNVLILALASGKILRIDLDAADQIDGNMAPPRSPISSNLSIRC